VEYVTKGVQALEQEPTSLAEAVASMGAIDAEAEDHNLDADHDDAPLRLCSINEVVGEGAAPGLAHKVLDGELNFTSAEELTTFHEVEQEVPQHAAMAKEMKAI
jgi:hypothetical protein